MKRKELQVIGLSYSQSQTGSYILVLTEKKGKAKLPVIIKPYDAQRIALEIEGIKSPRPMTHDLFVSLTNSYGIDIQEVFIHSLLEGVFYVKIISSNGIEEIEIDSSIGDAIILATIYKCPIYVESSILNTAGVYINDDGTQIDVIEEEEVDEEEVEKKGVVSIENLERALEDAIRNEEYEIAAAIRDRIEEIKKL
jgi:bifunctional DNase/RNase